LCGSDWKVGAHHLIKRGNKEFLHSPENGVPLCAVHHDMAECHPELWDEWAAENLPNRLAWVEAQETRPWFRLTDTILKERKKRLLKLQESIRTIPLEQLDWW